MPSPTVPIRLRLWGTPEWIGESPLRFAAERRFQLLLMLALASGAWVDRDRAAALLWPEASMADARRNLRKVLFMAQALPGITDLEATTQALRWTVATEADALGGGAGRDADTILALRRGPPLQGLDDPRNGAWTEWLAAERSRLDRLWLSAVHAHLQTQESTHCVPTLRAATARRLLEVDPLDEAAIAVLLRAELDQGRLAAAQAAYRQYAAELAQQLGVEPSRVLRDMLREPPPTVPPPVRIEPTAHLGSDPFIGRRQELAELQAMLERPECRLLTILGPGGIGKSSLARQALRAVPRLFPGGVLWLDLQDLSDAQALLPRWGQEAGIELPASGDPLPALLGQLPTERTLVVLDNAEHLGDLPALLLRVQQGSPSLVLLVTSRVRLHLAGEWLLPLQGLAVPDEDSRDLEAASSFDAVRLFERCAKSAQPRFELAEHLDAVIGITESVAGLPLAIELAAGWVRLMPPEQIDADLRQSMDLLQQHPAAATGTARPEHQDVRQLLERSVALLSPAERRALAALAVFHGDFSVDDARALELPATLPLLSALVDKSLLSIDRQATPARFRLHPLVHSHAAGLLAADAPLSARMRRAHAVHVARFMASLEPLTRTNALQLVNRIEAEYGNAVAAWDEAVALQDAGLLGHIVRALWVYFELSCRLEEGARRLWPALDVLAAQAAAGRAQAPWALARLRHGLSMLLHRLGRQQEALAVAEAGIGAGLAGAELEAHCGCMLNAGSCLWAQGRVAEAHARFEQALALARKRGDRHCTAWSLGNLNVTLLDLGRPQEALVCGEEALAIDRELGNQYQVAVHLMNLATTHFDLRQYARSAELTYEAIDHCQRCRLLLFARHAQGNLSGPLLKLGRHEEARPHVQSVLAHARTTGLHGTEVGMQVVLSRIEMAAGRGPTAWAALREALRVGEAHDLQVERLFTLRGLARLLAAQGDRVGAARVLDMVASHPLCSPGVAAAIADTRTELAISDEDRTAAQARPLTMAQAMHWVESGQSPP